MYVTLKNGKEVEIRHVGISDASNVLDYMHTVLNETQNLMREPDEFNMTVKQEEDFIKRVINSDHEVMLIALDNGKVISTSGIHGNPLRRVRHRVNLGISILRDYRGLGLGKILMKELEKEAIKLGKQKIDLEVRSDNIAGVKLYEKVGYEHEGIIKDGFYVNGEYIDLIKMGLNLRRK